MTCARVAQLVEHDLAKVGVAGSSPVSRSSRDTVNSRVYGIFFIKILVKILIGWLRKFSFV